MADDDDSGESFMRKHMSENQPSREAGGLGDKSRSTATKGTDDYYEQKYGKPIDLGASGNDVKKETRPPVAYAEARPTD